MIVNNLHGERREILFGFIKIEGGIEKFKRENKTVSYEGVLDGSCEAESCVRGTFYFCVSMRFNFSCFIISHLCSFCIHILLN